MTQPNYTPGPAEQTLMSTEQHEVVLARLAFSAFQGEDVHFIGTPGNYALAIEGGEQREVVGSGIDPSLAIYHALQSARQKERLTEKPLVALNITPSQSVSLTKYDDFRPVCAPGAMMYEVPAHLQPYIRGFSGVESHKRTVMKEAWKRELYGVVDQFITTDPEGKELAERLGVRSLQHLTPEQAVKLSVELIGAVSSFSELEFTKSVTGAVSADSKDVAGLIREGIKHRHDPEWGGNGVCRHFGTNVQLVFESLKASQGAYSMLTNVYIGVPVGFGGDGYEDARKTNDAQTNPRSQDGHAWNTLVAVDASGSATIAIVDVTWAIGERKSDKLGSLDYTLERGAKIIGDLLDVSLTSDRNYAAASDYYSELTRLGGLAPNKNREERIRGYALQEYVKLADKYPNAKDSAVTLDRMVGTAHQLRGSLSQHELQTLFKREVMVGLPNEDKLRDTIRKNFFIQYGARNNEIATRGRSNLPDPFLTLLASPDANFQAFILSSFSEEQLQKFTAEDTGFALRRGAIHAKKR